MIPKKIHYCWFGRNPKPELALKCIKSWKRKCRNYQIVEWNEDNFDISKAPLYVRQAYEAKKWAFVTDYVRLYVLYEYGGIYMDTDVEVLKSLDSFLHHEAFSGFEDEIHIPTGIMAASKGYSLFKTLLDRYTERSFIKEDGSYDLKTNVIEITEYCSQHGFKPNNSFQVIEGFALYPKDFFCPLSYITGELNKTKNTVTIHWFSGSWHSAEQRKKHSEDLKKMKRDQIRDYLIHIPNRISRFILGDKIYESLKNKLKK